MAKITQTVRIRQKKPDGRTTDNPNRAVKRAADGISYKTCGTCGGSGRVRAK